jgi:putative intracellular protease/amidase
VSKRWWAWIGAGIAVLAVAGCGQSAPLPPAPTDDALSDRQAQAFVDALKPRRAGKPVVAILALNDRTETTDFLLPHAVLQRAGVAEVQAVAPRRGTVTLYPAFQVEVTQDLAGFDAAHPGGADYVVVPAMEPDNDAAVTGWLRRQAEKGAVVVSVCRGARVVGQAGLLDGRHYTGHWSDRSLLAERHPGAIHVPHRRYLFDRGVASATGISASVPTALALVQAIGGREKAQALAAEIGVADWGPKHDSTGFQLDARRRFDYLLNKATALGRHERRRLAVRDGSDDIALALVADAWSRSGRVEVDAALPTGDRVTLRSGLVLRATPPAANVAPLPLDASLKPMQQLDRTLCEIRDRFGASRHEWVLLEMEYAGTAAACGQV